MDNTMSDAFALSADRRGDHARRLGSTPKAPSRGGEVLTVAASAVAAAGVIFVLAITEAVAAGYAGL